MMTKLKRLFGLLVFLFLTTNLGWGSFSSLNQKGNKEYKGGNYDKALKYYQDAEIEKPESPELSYNLGNVLHQQGKFQDALGKYQKAQEGENVLDRAKAYYNLGNTYYRAGDFQGAVDSYQKCLELNPQDEDAKYNLEFVRKKMKEMMNEQKKREEQQKDQKQNQQDQQNQKNQSPQDKNQEQNKQNQEQKENQSDQNQKNQPEQKEQQQLPPKEKEGMTQEDAERILNSIKDDEKDLQKEMKKFKIPVGRVGKDW
jgi:Ca-activated chloride channel family protein